VGVWGAGSVLKVQGEELLHVVLVYDVALALAECEGSF